MGVMAKRPEFKRGIKTGRIIDWPAEADSPEEVAERVTYTGNRLHKTHPTPAGSPAWRQWADKAKCDIYGEEQWPLLLNALQEAIRARCVGGPFTGGFPSRAWVWINEVLHEARLTGNGDYHGFPLDDPRHYPEPTDLLENAPRVHIPIH
jgi:hypothetical protein